MRMTCALLASMLVRRWRLGCRRADQGGGRLNQAGGCSRVYEPDEGELHVQDKHIWIDGFVWINHPFYQKDYQSSLKICYHPDGYYHLCIADCSSGNRNTGCIDRPLGVFLVCNRSNAVFTLNIYLAAGYSRSKRSALAGKIAHRWGIFDLYVDSFFKISARAGGTAALYLASLPTGNMVLEQKTGS